MCIRDSLQYRLPGSVIYRDLVGREVNDLDTGIKKVIQIINKVTGANFLIINRNDHIIPVSYTHLVLKSAYNSGYSLTILSTRRRISTFQLISSDTLGCFSTGALTARFSCV